MSTILTLALLALGLSLTSLGVVLLRAAWETYEDAVRLREEAAALSLEWRQLREELHELGDDFVKLVVEEGRRLGVDVGGDE